MVFVFAFVTLSNANTSTKSISIPPPGTCFQQAWDYGTAMGHGDPYWEWYYTNQYYNQHCENQ